LILQKKHIVFITPGFPENEADTTCIPALQIYAKELQEQKNIQLSIITLHYPFTKTEYNWHKVKVIPLGFNNRKLVFKKSLVQKTLNKLHQQNPIHTLHSFWLGECALAGYKFSKKHSLKHICTLMGQDAKKGNKYANLLPLKDLKLITLSSFHQQLFLKNYNKETEIINWGLPSDFQKETTKKTIDIIGVGSLIELKRYQDFIETIALLKKDFPKIKAVLIGDGKQRKKLENLSEKLKLSQNITFKGELDYKATQEKIAQSKILLHPSSYESFGMVFAEALANNTKIVSRKTGFAKESDFWKTTNSPKGFAKLISIFFNENSTKKMTYPLIENTLKGYLKLYKNEENH